MPPPTSKPLSPVISTVQRAVARTKAFRENPIKAYGAAIVVVALFFGLRLAVGETLQAAPFLLFFPAIIIATFLGGVGAGIAAAVSSSLLAWYFFVPTYNSFEVTASYALSVAVFAIIGGFGAVMVGWLMQIAGHIADFEAHEQSLLRELQHRVKNHVQIVSSLLQIQSRRADPTTQAALQEAGRRLATISTVYGSLYRSGHQIDFRTHLEDLCHVASRAAPDTQCEFKVDAEPVSWGMDLVMPLSLIAGELIANAIQHGCAGQSGTVEVTLQREKGNVTLTVADTGARLPDGFDVEKTKGLGLQLVRTLTRQIQGHVSAHRNAMTRFILEFPENPTEPH
jgi:two-component system, sensor histidine kinase PdtaS